MSWWNFKKNQQIDEQIRREQVEIFRLKVHLNDEQVQAMRERVLQSISNSEFQQLIKNSTVQERQSHFNLVENLQQVAAQVKLNTFQTAAIKRRINEESQNILQKQRWWLFWGGMRRVFAAVLLLIFSFSLVIFYPLDKKILKAGKFTLIDTVKGEVFVNRGGQLMAVNKDFSLEEGDLVFTEENSFVVIKFLDDSVARLDEKTFLEIKKLYAAPENITQTQVNLGLVEGQAWAKVPNLTGNEAVFEIETDEAKASVRDGAAFTISAKKGETKLLVYENVVDVSKKNVPVQTVKPVISGYSAEIKQVTTATQQAVVIAIQEKTASVDNTWAEMNQDLDQQYEKLLAEANDQWVKDALSNSNTFVRMWSDLQDSTKAIFLNSEIERLRKDYLANYNSFLTAYADLKNLRKGDGKRTEILKNLNQFKSNVIAIRSELVALRNDYPEQVDLLNKVIDETLSIQRKNLAGILVSDAQYLAKATIWDVSEAIAEDDSERMEVIFARARNTLLETQIYIKQNQLNKVADGLRRYDALVAEYLALGNANAQNGEWQKSIFSLFTDQLDQVKLLSAVEKQLQKKLADSDTLEMIGELKLKNIMTINAYLLKDQVYVPYAWLQDYQAILENYFVDSKSQATYLATVQNLMQKYPEAKLATDQNAWSLEQQEVSEQNVDILVDQLQPESNATSEVQEAAKVLDFAMEEITLDQQ